MACLIEYTHRSDGWYFIYLPEQGSDLTALLTGGGGEPKDFYEFLAQLAELENDEVEHVLFDLSAGFAFNRPQLAEIERVVHRVKKSGKKLWAYVEGAGNPSYQIAALCDQILVADLGGVEISAPSMNVTFLKDAFDLLGVGTDVVRCGDSNGAVEPYVLAKMSSHLRDHYLAMLEPINRDAVREQARLLAFNPRFGANCAVLIDRLAGLRSAEQLSPEPADETPRPAFAGARWRDDAGRVWQEIDLSALVRNEQYLAISA